MSVQEAVNETVRRMLDPNYAAQMNYRAALDRWLLRGGAIELEMTGGKAWTTPDWGNPARKEN